MQFPQFLWSVFGHQILNYNYWEKGIIKGGKYGGQILKYNSLA